MAQGNALMAAAYNKDHAAKNKSRTYQQPSCHKRIHENNAEQYAPQGVGDVQGHGTADADHVHGHVPAAVRQAAEPASAEKKP